ncbi:HGxxPAAW family protein [Streptomyces sp. NPDC091267]|uniref:HGxxPAAW family protein n=1 Tax=unclassified Streptomyces TaxID=2593676 RepID=UPI00343AD17D
MSAHENVDLGHTVAGWTGTALGVAGLTCAGIALCVKWDSGFAYAAAMVVTGALATWLLHLRGWGKPSGPRPADQWPWRVRDTAALSGHPGCLGCRLAGRTGPAATRAAQPADGGHGDDRASALRARGAEPAELQRQ